MVKKLQKMSADSKKKPTSSSEDGNAPLAQAVKDSAQQIWLAGLGAFAKAQEEGSKMFDSLVKDGLSMQRKTQSAAEDKISVASEKMVSMASGIQSKAGHQWDKLETIFEERVAKALGKIGVPTRHEIDALNARIDALSGPVAAKSRRSPAKKAAPAPVSVPVSTPAVAAKTVPVAKKAAARKAAVKTAPPAAPADANTSAG